MKKTNITIDDIRDSLYELDTEYRESLASVLMKLKYVSDSPLNLNLGTKEQQKELKRVYTTPLRPEQIIEIIKYMMDEMKDDFQYSKFKPIALKYINIAEEMKKEELNEKVAVKSGYYFEIFSKSEIPNTLIESNIQVSLNNKVYKLYKASSIEDERKIDKMFGDRMGYDIDEHTVNNEEEME